MLLREVELWDAHFDMWPLCTVNHKFALYLTTDGTQASVHMKRPAREPPAPPSFPMSLVGKQLLGLDPGRRHFYTAVSDSDSKEHRDVRRCSTGHYYERAGFTARQRWMERRLAAAGLQGWQSRIPRHATADLAAQQQRVAYVTERLEELVMHYCSAPWRKKKWSVRVQKQRVLANEVRRLTGGRPKEQVVVAFGDGTGGRGGCIKGSRMPPIKQFRQLLQRFATVLVIDEFLTSQRCPRCEAQYTSRVSYAVPVCNHCGTHWDRDVAAAKNMLRIARAEAAGLPRPADLRRGG